SSCLGAALCFAAGFVLAKRKREGNSLAEPITTLGSDPMGEQLHWERSAWQREKAQLEQQLAAAAHEVQAATKKQEQYSAEQQLAAAAHEVQSASQKRKYQSTEQQLAAAAQKEHAAAQERERHSTELHRLRQQMQELSSEATRAKDRLVGADREREALVHQVAKLEAEVSRTQAKSEEAGQARRVLEQKASALQSELGLTKKRLVEAQASHEDYIRLRTRRDEDTFLKSEVERLKAQLVAARAGGS